MPKLAKVGLSSFSLCPQLQYLQGITGVTRCSINLLTKSPDPPSTGVKSLGWRTHKFPLDSCNRSMRDCSDLVSCLRHVPLLQKVVSEIFAKVPESSKS